MNVLVTGGTGFIGSRLAIACIKKGYACSVYGQVNTDAEALNSQLLKENGVRVILGSVTESEKLLDIVKGVDIVYHLAATQHEANVPDAVFRDVNVEGTRRMLDACVAAGVKRFIHGSTIGVYGSVEEEIDEDSPCRPDNIYGKTKLEGERLVLSYQDKLPVVVIRISETYGPGDRRLLKLFKAVGNRFFFMIGRGRNLHQLIYIDDLINGFFLAADSDRSVGQIFLLVGKKPITTNEMVHTIAEQIQAAPPKIRLPFFPFWMAAVILETVLKPLGIQPPLHRRRMNFFIKSFSFKTKKALEILGFSPAVDFREGAGLTAAWYSEMGYLKIPNALQPEIKRESLSNERSQMKREISLTAETEPFDTFWEAPADIEKGYGSFAKFYKRNYLKYLPSVQNSNILVISCGPGYFVNLLTEMGCSTILGIDSDPEKIEYARRRNLNCEVHYAFEFLEKNENPYDVIFVEQEINHLTKTEILEFLSLCQNNLVDNGRLVVHSLNGANPITGSEALAQNFDHYNTFTEYSLKQVLEHAGFEKIRVFPLFLYIFYENPINYVGLILDKLLNIVFRLAFIFYGKSNKLFSKKIGAVCRKPISK